MRNTYKLVIQLEKESKNRKQEDGKEEKVEEERPLKNRKLIYFPPYFVFK
jgi:hypothetical protein